MEDFITQWIEFENDILYNNRFFCNHKMIKNIELIVSKNNEILPKSTQLFRARIIPHNQINKDAIEIIDNEYKITNFSEFSRLLDELGIHGFNAEHSGMPPKDETIDGRANPKYIPYLYLAKHPYTALAECKPYQFDSVSIATYTTNKELKLADFRNFSETNTKDEDLINELIGHLNYEFSHPVRDNDKDYIITQVISGYIKSLGYDGIIFMSSLHKWGDNITLFNDDGCDFLQSDVYDITDIVFKTKPNVLNYNSKDITPEKYLQSELL